MASKAEIVGFCPRYLQAVELIGRRWTGAIVRQLLNGAKRFGELAAGIPDMSDRMLAERLRELENEGIVIRTVIPEIPIRVEYSLTPKGLALDSAIRALAHWAEEWIAPGPGYCAEAVMPAAPHKKASASFRKQEKGAPGGSRAARDTGARTAPVKSGRR